MNASETVLCDAFILTIVNRVLRSAGQRCMRYNSFIFKTYPHRLEHSVKSEEINVLSSQLPPLKSLSKNDHEKGSSLHNGKFESLATSGPEAVLLIKLLCWSSDEMCNYTVRMFGCMASLESSVHIYTLLKDGRISFYLFTAFCLGRSILFFR